MRHSIHQRLKDQFMRLSLHRFIEPFSPFLQKLIALSQLSKWRKHTPVTGNNDFYISGFDYSKRYSNYQFISDKYQLKITAINFVEFGVEEGNSLKWWLAENQCEASIFIGLDTFEGLPEKWGYFKKGDMSFPMEQLTITDSRLRLFRGLFQQTANKALELINQSSRSIFHMDADIFSSTLFALTQCYRFMKPGDLVLFDEFTTPTHEFSAFKLFTESFYIEYEVISAAANYSFLAIEIKKIPWVKQN
ncbi:MAG TPA: TylF/MycF/NovP-related O-methyltransferase [Flavitalea sp.]|nr:TylF/MycF/NovP-related O-methyltransferase [Flavitalea sp.]